MITEKRKLLFFLKIDALLTVLLLTLKLHCCRWRRIEDGTESIQSLQAIPWPPFSTGTMLFMAGGCHCRGDRLHSTDCSIPLSHRSSQLLFTYSPKYIAVKCAACCTL